MRPRQEKKEGGRGGGGLRCGEGKNELSCRLSVSNHGMLGAKGQGIQLAMRETYAWGSLNAAAVALSFHVTAVPTRHHRLALLKGTEFCTQVYIPGSVYLCFPHYYSAFVLKLEPSKLHHTLTPCVSSRCIV